MDKPPRLFALLAGINDYPSPAPALHGCLNDVAQMAAFLTEEVEGLSPNLRILRNEEATKAAIVEGFQQHLAQAGPGDTALFYFAGHGSQEEADPGLWRFEVDGKLESLVCYDSIAEQGGQLHYNLLADKELRFLIHRLSQKGAHILTIFDCCHSGGNTRNNYLQEAAPGLQGRRYQPRLAAACPPRPWARFLFADAVSPEALRAQPLPSVLPAGRHIQLAACESGQTAFEQEGGGAFTHGLLQLLRATGGNISYYNLASRLRFQLRHQFGQSPQLYASGTEGGEQFQGFLGREVQEDKLRGNVVFNEKMGWVLGLGSIHGLNDSIRQVWVKTAGTDHKFPVKISGIKASYALLAEAGARLDPKLAYAGYIEGALSPQPRVWVAGEEEGAAPLREKLEKNKSFRMAETDTARDYTVWAVDGKYLITAPHAPREPLVKAIEGYAPASAARALQYLRHIGRWEFVKGLHNPNLFLFKSYPVEITFFRQQSGGGWQPIAFEGDAACTDYEWDGSRWTGKVRIQLANRYERPLYVSLLFLSLNFQVYSRLLGDAVARMAPGATAWAFEGQAIELDFPRQVADFNWPFSPAYFQIIASTTEFDTMHFEQPPLPAPSDTDARHLQTGAYRDTVANFFVGDDWISRMVELRVRNPGFVNRDW